MRFSFAKSVLGILEALFVCVCACVCLCGMCVCVCVWCVCGVCVCGAIMVCGDLSLRYVCIWKGGVNPCVCVCVCVCANALIHT